MTRPDVQTMARTYRRQRRRRAARELAVLVLRLPGYAVLLLALGLCALGALLAFGPGPGLEVIHTVREEFGKRRAGGS